VSGIVLAEAVMDRLRERHPGYHEASYLFVLAALQFTIERVGEPRHISGRELCEGARDLALARWGPLARSVLDYWGIRSTRDLGELVFALIECGVLVRREEDSMEDFEGLFDFEESFDKHYPWAAPDGLGM
jgi:uncharacterized repeat protein (TIGR04138 family)